MSLSDRLSSAQSDAKNVFCKIGNLLQGDNLPARDREQLETALNAPLTDSKRITNAALARVLREEGHDISDSSMDRHRRKDCSCYRKASK
jgi:hypothetical protein